MYWLIEVEEFIGNQSAWQCSYIDIICPNAPLWCFLTLLLVLHRAENNGNCETHSSWCCLTLTFSLSSSSNISLLNLPFSCCLFYCSHFLSYCLSFSAILALIFILSLLLSFFPSHLISFLSSSFVYLCSFLCPHLFLLQWFEFSCYLSLSMVDLNLVFSYKHSMNVMMLCPFRSYQCSTNPAKLLPMIPTAVIITDTQVYYYIDSIIISSFGLLQ